MAKKEFAEALKQFCLERGFQIAGTCGSEGIYGEITIKKVGEGGGWLDWDENVFNFDWLDEEKES